jgi:hypothetical protein
MFEHLLWSGWAVVQVDNATEPYAARRCSTFLGTIGMASPGR